MGQEIEAARFRHYDFHRFDRLIEQEMAVLHGWFRDRRFSSRRSVGGLELEAWLVDRDGMPAPRNHEVIAQCGLETVVPELARFNIEFNVSPQPLARGGLAALHAELDATWRHCDRIAAELDGSVVAIGILPTVTQDQLSLKHISSLNRYRALNEQVLRLRQGQPIRLDIEGPERLQTLHHDVMLEAGTTSFQLHIQVAQDEAVRFLNAASILSAPMVAISANSPLLFGKLLWEETRIPLFEQALAVGSGAPPRVTFGASYADESLEELFIDNRRQYPVMLPLSMEEPSSRLAHVSLHNGTVWRWNRPLIGFDEDGTPHLRIEHRVMAAGPTTIDMTAGMALYYGLVESLATRPVAPESLLPFAAARDNFYRAARRGLDAEITWLDGARHPVRTLVLRELIPLARQGLERLRVDSGDIAHWLGIVEARVARGQNGAAWQRRFIARHGRDLALLTREYRARQRSGRPVHLWDC